ncbi:hypothetical protein F5I97DRAFT_1964416 [Phlebopus sp. FC_14]|nr:hypothetical protein F5I97DRAFT_1964416 [Phlebopus sp. FC_14]
MTLLHVYFALRNQHAFQRLLERDRSAHSGAPSTSAGRSWQRGGSLASALEVNAFDDLGRTVLHLACTSTEPASLEYVRMLLAHPTINVNFKDKESHWTALHRAIYAGNIEAAILLLKRADIDTAIKDIEGYTAFDLYNSTVRGAKPSPQNEVLADLFTWGANRNAALGLGDANDRVHPDQVVLLRKDAPVPTSRTLQERFGLVRVREVHMSKLHTVIVTNESRDNVRLCGFGSGGRLGHSSHTIYTPTTLTLPTSHAIVSVALGQDHTLALTSAGEVLSWGLNRFSQLGYVVEAGQGGSADELVQLTPRKVGHLKKEFIEGVATCKAASACWSEIDVWTWGVNGGQLGYSKTASPVQVLPRKVSVITQPVRGIVMSETAMVCLFVSGEVFCVWNGGVSKINFPAHGFPSEFSVYRPPQAVRGPTITKLVGCDDAFAALSSNGEVFTFAAPATSEGYAGATTKGQMMKPQRAWALRRQFSSVRDVDIGGDGTLVVCTQSGHVFVRSRNLKGTTSSGGSKPFKFQRIAHIQRSVSVCANSTGAFGALRVDYKPPPICVTGRGFTADMADILPYVHSGGTEVTAPIGLDAIIDADEDMEDSSTLDDVAEVAKLMDILHRHAKGEVRATSPSVHHGADLVACASADFSVPVHRLVLAARCAPIHNVLLGDLALRDKVTEVSVTFSSAAARYLHFTGVSPLTLLILLHYLYSDGILAIWDRQIGVAFEGYFVSLGIQVARIKTELVALARILELPHLALALQSLAKRTPKPSLCDDFRHLFEQAQLSGSLRKNTYADPLAPDVAIQLTDEIVYAHSVVLRARCPFFSAFFDDAEWTTRRKDASGVIDIYIKHFNWQVMQFVFRYICFGEENLFETLNFLDTVDEVVDFMFLIIAAAVSALFSIMNVASASLTLGDYQNELLLSRLVLLSSQVVLRYLDAHNACYLLVDAIHFNATDLAQSIEDYIAANMEMFLESGILDDLDTRVVRKLAEHVRLQQADKSPVSRSNKLANAAMEKHKDWLVLQDIPGPVVPKMQPAHKDSPKISPLVPTRRRSPLFRPTSLPQVTKQSEDQGDELFAMDDTEAVPPLELSPSKPTLTWKKNPSAPRTDLKSIMAEAERNTKKPPSPAIQRNAVPGTSKMTEAPGSSQEPSTRWKTDSSPISRRVPSDGAMKGIPTETGRSTGASPATGPQTMTMSPASSSVSQSRSGASRANMGAVITPVRQVPSSPGPSATPRKASNQSAWTLPPVQPIVQPTAPSVVPSSFAEIQKSQQMQGASKGKDKVSLREIQEQEEARQQEEGFLKWWAAEEERVRLETIAAQEEEQPPSQIGKGKGTRPSPRKPKPERRNKKPSGSSQHNRP